MSSTPEVIADSSSKWASNALRFATREEAEAQVLDLMMRWSSVCDIRVVQSDDPANYRYATSMDGSKASCSWNRYRRP
jgi:hypothetical protein